MTTATKPKRSRAAAELKARRDAVQRRLLAPPPRLTLSEWADRHRVLSAESSAEPGPWRTDRAPYLRGIMDTLSDPMVRKVVWMACSQVGKTEVVLNAVGYYVDQDPAPILVIQPSERPMGEAFSKDRLAPMIRDAPRLRSKIRPAKARDSGNTILHKNFSGGHLTIAGANSPAGLASRPVRIGLFDEIDRYPASAGSEGDPLNLGRQRLQTFWNRKEFDVSTPGERPSRIDQEYQASDQRKYFVPCPHCDHLQVLRWDQLLWDKDVDEESGKTVRHHPDTAVYPCESCGAVIQERQKTAMLRDGEWVATNPKGRFPGFHLNALYSPWVRWSELVQKFLEAKDDPDQLKTFVNLQLGEPWEERNEEVSAEDLSGRAETYPQEVPAGAAVLTAATDVQGDRLEVAIWGWGPRQECWLISHERLYGDPEKDEVWSRLENILARPYQHELGVEMRIRAAMIDASYRSDLVYAFVRPREKRGVYAVQGVDGRARDLIKRAQRKNKSGVKLWTIHTWLYKDILFRRLPVATPGLPGYMHFCRPTATGADGEYFAQFEAEVPEIKNGQRAGYKKIRARNEAIDLYVYGLAALHTLGPGIYDHLDRQMTKLRTAAEKKRAEEEEGDDQEEGAQPLKGKRRRRQRAGGKGFVNRY